MPDPRNYTQMVSQYHSRSAVAQNTYHSLSSIDQSNSVKADARSYQRQAELNRLATISTAMNIGADVALYSGASAITSAMGATGVAAIAAPLAATAIPMAMVGRTLNDYLAKQRSIHGIGRDIDIYSSRLGFGTPLTYDQSTALGANMYSEFNRRGNFFSSEQQERIHKIGLSNDMMSARGADPGSMQQYQENFRKLRDTTAEVVKMMKTTIEGGMNIIKDMQNMGFGSLDDIRNQVKQVKALGDMAGIGTGNMTSVGFAGASYATNANPYWRASSGARAFQTGAASSAYIAAGSPGGAQAVIDVGGVANAGAILGRTQMENLQGSIGTRMLSYAMNPDGSIDESRLGSVMGGGVSAYGLVSGSNQRGYNMGASGRALFARNKRQALNALDPVQIARLDQRAFELWGQGRTGTMEAKAWVYSGMKTSGDRERELYYQSLVNPRGYGQIYAQQQLVEQTTNPLYNTGQPWWGRRMMSGAAQVIGETSDFLGQAAIVPAVSAWDRTTTGLGNIWDWGMSKVGRVALADPYYTHGDQGLGSRERSLRIAMGISRPLDMARGSSAYQRLRSTGGLERVGGLSPNLQSAFSEFDPNNLSREEFLNLGSMLTTASYQENPEDFLRRNSNLRRYTGVTRSQLSEVINTGQTQQFINYFANRLNLTAGEAVKEYNVSQSKIDKWMADPTIGLNDVQKQNMIGQARTTLWAKGDMSEFDPAVKRFVESQHNVYAKEGFVGAKTRQFKAFDRENFDESVNKLFKLAKRGDPKYPRMFEDFRAGRDYTDPEIALSMIDEVLDVREKITSVDYQATGRERELAVFGARLEEMFPKEYKDVKAKNVQRLGLRQAEFYASRSAYAIMSAERDGIRISPHVKKTLVDKPLEMEFVQKNRTELGNIFDISPDKIGKLKSTEEVEWEFFNNRSAKQRSMEQENNQHRQNIRKLSNAIINGMESIDLEMVSNKGEVKKIAVDKGDMVGTLQALKAQHELTQKPTMTTNDLGKSTVVNAQPMVMNYWNNNWQ